MLKKSIKKRLLFINFYSVCLFSIFYSVNISAKEVAEKKIVNAGHSKSLKDEEEFLEFENSFNSAIIQDPYESINRKIFKFNDSFDRYFLEPIAKTYRYTISRNARKSVANFTNNISLPISAVNSFAQGKIENGLATLSNFLINSTIGVFGLFDVAGKKGIKYNQEDFGQTLAHYKSPSGSFLMLPFFGPSTTRDFGGMLLDKSVDIFSLNLLQIGGSHDIVADEYRIGMTVGSVVSSRESLIEIIDGVRKDSFDPYSTVRSVYIQRREAQIKN